MENYCDKCGQNFAVHNSDGSCIDDKALKNKATVSKINERLQYLESLFMLKDIPYLLVSKNDGKLDAEIDMSDGYSVVVEENLYTFEKYYEKEERTVKIHSRINGDKLTDFIKKYLVVAMM